ncbi:MAG TPA: SprT family zinc-dependent metalloprotease [Xanthomonadales bacterium]|nr:SprT family zinc-dependent metalloprotease [Xanthomonadales bacterium]
MTPQRSRYGPIRLADQVIHYEIAHRPRVTRRIHLELSERGALRVVAPRRMSQRAIHHVLASNPEYVARFLDRARRQWARQAPPRYVDGEKHYLLGRRYPLDIWRSRGARPRLEWLHDRIRMTFPQAPEVEAVRDLLLTSYRQRALEDFSGRLEAICADAPWACRLPPMRLRRMKATWGTCSADGVITLNPLLLRAPPDCIDYVIAHEVCHLRQHNHGPRFYALQDQLFPAWPAAKQHLQDRGFLYLQL